MFTPKPIIVFFYSSAMADIQILVFARQSIILTPSLKENDMKQITCYLCPGGFLNGKDIIIANIIVFWVFMKSYHYWSSNYWFPHHI